MNTPESTERDAILKVLARHRFQPTEGSGAGFCGGPYCATGIISATVHDAHVADMLLSIPPGTTDGGA